MTQSIQSGDILSDRYQLIERAGEGQYGDVWHASELLKGVPIRDVAVKIIKNPANASEIQKLAQLSNHVHILGYLAHFEHNGSICMVTEYADGGDVSRLLLAHKDGMPPALVAEIVASVAAALDHLHSQSWIHRDVKPSNILYVGTVLKLADVGIARLATHDITQTVTLGTVAYLAPEAFAGKVQTHRDIYALGVTAFELLTGRLPFTGDAASVMYQHLNIEAQIPPTLPAEMQSLLRCCLEKEPKQRPSALEVCERLGRRSSGGPQLTAPQSGTPPLNSAPGVVSSAQASAPSPLTRPGSSTNRLPVSSGSRPTAPRSGTPSVNPAPTVVPPTQTTVSGQTVPSHSWTKLLIGGGLVALLTLLLLGATTLAYDPPPLRPVMALIERLSSALPFVPHATEPPMKAAHDDIVPTPPIPPQSSAAAAPSVGSPPAPTASANPPAVPPPAEQPRVAPTPAAERPVIEVTEKLPTLSAIAADQLGDSGRWPEIYALNVRDIGENPHRLTVGLRLMVPLRNESPQLVTVVPGDGLRKIAQEQLGSEDLFQYIYWINRDVIGDDQNYILAGMKLIIPPKSAVAEKPQ